MTNANRPVVLVTGASQGLGAAIASRLAERAEVYAASRSGQSPRGAHAIKMDVTNAREVREGTDSILARSGRLDVVINNAGIILSQPAELTSIESIQHQMEVNFFGAVRVSQSALPSMRKQNAGTILNISSMAAAVPLPFRAAYAASKAAMEAWFWGLRLEVQPFQIGVCCVQVGDCCTELSAHEAQEFQPVNPGVYSVPMQQAVTRCRKEEAAGIRPEDLAHQIDRILKETPTRLRFRYTAGHVSQRSLFLLRHVLPERWIEALIRRMYLTGDAS